MSLLDEINEYRAEAKRVDSMRRLKAEPKPVLLHELRNGFTNGPYEEAAKKLAAWRAVLCCKLSIARTDWTPAKLLRPALVQAFIIHHTETRTDASPEVIHAGHVLENGWVGIGYHRLVRLGEVHPGRPLEREGSHAPGWNYRSIGIALVGDYRAEVPTDAQVGALAELLGVLSKQFGRKRIIPHNVAMAQVGKPKHTDCPGSNWVEMVRQVTGWGW